MHDTPKVDKQALCEPVENNGIPTFKFKCWNDFFNYVNNMGKYDADFIWRGQADSKWEIVSSLKRQEIFDFHHLVNFKDAISHLTSTTFKIYEGEENAEQERLKLWALGQHFGLMTPLILSSRVCFISTLDTVH